MLPEGFPHRITVRLVLGERGGEPRLEGTYTHNGKNYLVVVHRVSGQRIESSDRRTCVLSPVNVVNDHVVFCRFLESTAGQIAKRDVRWERSRVSPPNCFELEACRRVVANWA